jgi:hypothetical protein
MGWSCVSFGELNLQNCDGPLERQLEVSASCCVDRREMGKALWGWEWMELAQDRVQRRALVLAVLNLGVLLPQCQLVRWILVRQVVRMGVDGTGSGSCPGVGFGISGVGPWGSATTDLSKSKNLSILSVFILVTWPGFLFWRSAWKFTVSELIYRKERHWTEWR